MHRDTTAIVIGAGPAGIGPLVCAMQSGEHHHLLEQGVTWIEQGNTIGSGAIPSYAISSDTAASVLLECLEGASTNSLRVLADGKLARLVQMYGNGSLPLSVAGQFLAEIGTVARDQIELHPHSSLRLGRRATRLKFRSQLA
jgi:hypothetical protein